MRRRGAYSRQAVLATIGRLTRAAAFEAPRPKERYAGRVRLEPVEIRGPWWRQHRYWLTSPSPFAGDRYVVVNERTGAAYRWRFRGNRRGRGWFGVRTRWAWFHPEWKQDPWWLLHDPEAR